MRSAAIFLLKAYLNRYLRAFVRALNSPVLAQQRCLRQIIRAQAQTDYGRHLGLTGAEVYEEFIQKVPLSRYEDVHPWVARQRQRRQVDHLTPGPVACYEPTSGSSGFKKLIPYNKALLQSFSRLFMIWAADILQELGTLRSGRFFFSVTPFGDQQGDESLPDDASYVQGFLHYVLRWKSAVPPVIKKLRTSEDYYLGLSLYLLAAADLELVSIWNPHLFLQTLSYIESHREALCAMLPRGSTVISGVELRWRAPSRSRMDQIKSPAGWQAIWPKLRLISCWDSAHAGMSANALRRLFPQVLVQGKGLLATEAPVTVPLFALRGSFPVLTEVFFEFLDEQGAAHRLHELEDGAIYEVVVTQKSGLLRYRLGDLVRVRTMGLPTPALEFLSRSGLVSDLVGEKLHEAQVQEALAQGGGSRDFFWLCLPTQRSDGTGAYVLVTDQPQGYDLVAMEETLMGSHHYALAIKLRQLAPLSMVHQSDARARYYQTLVQHGIKLGDIKDALLIRDLRLAGDIQDHLGWVAVGEQIHS